MEPNFATWLYWIALTVIIMGTVFAVLHPGIETGAFGTFALGGVAMFALLGFDVSPPNWLVGGTTCGAAWIAWLGWRRLLAHCAHVWRQAGDWIL